MSKHSASSQTETVRPWVETPEPGSPDWPCRTDFEDKELPPRAVAFFYVLLRDYVQPGDAEQVAIQVRNSGAGTEFTNLWIEAYARALVTYLLEPDEAERRAVDHLLDVTKDLDARQWPEHLTGVVRAINALANARIPT